MLRTIQKAAGSGPWMIRQQAACALWSVRPLLCAMPRKPLPEPPPEQRKLPMRSRVAKVRPEKEPKPAPSIPDLWEAFDVVWGFGEPVEAETP